MGDPAVKVAHITVSLKKRFQGRWEQFEGAREISRALVREGILVQIEAPTVQRPGLTNPLCFPVENNGPVRGSGTGQMGQQGAAPRPFCGGRDLVEQVSGVPARGLLTIPWVYPAAVGWG